MAIDVEKHIAYWRKGAKEDMDTARMLLEKKGKKKECLFFVHLSLEKALKSLVVKETEKIPPYIHNLPILAKKAGLTLSQETLDYLADMNQYVIIGRYPDMAQRVLSTKYVEESYQKAKELIKWCLNQL